MPVVWRLIDGKAGHERQTAGFIKALSKITPCDTYEIETTGFGVCRSLLRRKLPKLPLANPDLIIGAGSQCQWPMLLLKHRFGGQTVYFMRPGLPSRLFDLCVVPRHDHPTEKSWIIVSEGVLNDLSPAEVKKADLGVILIGGPSRHHSWNDDALVQQVRAVITHHPAVQFQLSPSRRTPKRTTDKLRDLAGVEYFDLRDLDDSWLPRTLSAAAIAWVSADSVSMIYEALSCGANVGLLEVPVKREDRISRIADDLVSRRLVTKFSTWKQTKTMADSPLLQESDRIAGLVNDRLFGKTGAQ